MHPCLGVDEILSLFARELVASGAKATAVALARCCRSFEESALDALWETQEQLTPLLKCIPGDVWKEGDSVFKRIPTKSEWAHSRRYARRMRKIVVDPSKDPVTSDILLVVQLRTVNDPWLPNLREFKCHGATGPFIPFIPLFLSPATTAIHIRCTKGSHAVLPVVATVISRFSTLCLNLERVTILDLPRDPIVTEAVSEILLACNRDTLQVFCVDTPLTEEAREVVYQLPRLSCLWTVIQRSASLPAVALPNLTEIAIEYDGGHNWLQGFRGAKFEKLESIAFHTESDHIGDFLGAFERITPTIPAMSTLSQFKFITSRSWNPNYYSLLSFNQLKTVIIDFSCDDGCSSRVDDDTIVGLARAMPKLEVLQLGRAPCRALTGVTVNGLIVLAHRCPRLSELRIHFLAFTLVEAATSAARPSPSAEPVVRREDCVLACLEVGGTPIPVQSRLAIAMLLLQIFPHLLDIGYTNREWKTVRETIKDFRRIGGFVQRSRNALDEGSMEDS